MGVQAEPQHGDARDAALAAHEPAIEPGDHRLARYRQRYQPGRAESETYSRLNPPYQCKNSFFESVEELRLVYGADPHQILYGDDYNRNGVLDLNENDADLSPPNDNRDGVLDSGILDFLTVFTREPNTRTNSSPRINVNSADAAELTQMLRKSSARRKPHPQDSISGRRHEFDKFAPVLLRAR